MNEIYKLRLRDTLSWGMCCVHRRLLFPVPLPPGWAGSPRVIAGLAVPSYAGSDNPDLSFSTSVHFNCPKIDDRCKENNEA